MNNKNLLIWLLILLLVLYILNYWKSKDFASTIIVLLILLSLIYLLFTDTTVDLFDSVSGTEGKPFIGAWVSDIGCGKGLKHAILGSALPQEWKSAQGSDQWPSQKDFFEGHINGNYEPGMSDGFTKYLISVGGSNATPKGWSDFLEYPDRTAKQLDAEFKKRGLMGIDFDLEGTTPEHQKNIKLLVTNLKKLNSNYIVVYTLLLGQPETFTDLINDGQMDYVALMLYNGGMYEANKTGGGCDWDSWAEMLLSACKAGCNRAGYCQGIKTDNLKNKIVLGVITDTDGKKVNITDMKKTMDLVKKYNGAGIYLWVLPGWVGGVNSRQLFCNDMMPEMIKYNNTIGNIFQMHYVENGKEMTVGCNAKCGSGGGDDEVVCSQEICDKSCAECVVTACGKKKQNVTNTDCAPCATGQTWWPCNQPGFCSCKRKK